MCAKFIVKLESWLSDRLIVFDCDSFLHFKQLRKQRNYVPVVGSLTILKSVKYNIVVSY